MNWISAIARTLSVVERLYIQHLEEKYQDLTIELKCKRCNSSMKPAFSRCEYSTFFPWSHKKIFKCENCKGEMYEDGKIIVTLMDRIDGFLKAEKNIESIAGLESLLANNQKLAANYHQELLDIKEQASKANADNALLNKKLHDLFEKIKEAKQKAA